MTQGQPEIHDEKLATLRREIEERTGKTPEQLFEERDKRVRDVIELREPDRVPLWIFPNGARFSSLSNSAAYYKPVAWKEATRNDALAFEPDMALAGFATSGLTWEALQIQNRLWPGGPLPPDYEYQFVEGEYMKEDEYDLFLSDPSDFIVRYYLPRMFGALKPLSRLPRLSQMYGSFDMITGMFADPEFEQMARALSKAGKALNDYRYAVGDAQEELALLGFPPFSYFGGAGGAPFDTISSFFRGMTGSMVDMFRRPDKLLQACDMILEQRIAAAIPADPNARGNPKRVGIPLWRGDKAFMSDAQFRKFYWPGLKKAMLASIDMGYVPMPFFEATFGERLECLLELPKGKVLAMVYHTDALLAKKILGDHTCIITNAPYSMKQASVQAVTNYYKGLIDTCGQGGGLIIEILFPDGAGKEELLAMVNEIKEYGRY